MSLALGVAFLTLGALFSAGWLPLAASHEVGRGEALVISLSCLVVGAYFLRSAVLGRRRSPDKQAS